MTLLQRIWVFVHCLQFSANLENQFVTLLLQGSSHRFSSCNEKQGFVRLTYVQVRIICPQISLFLGKVDEDQIYRNDIQLRLHVFS